MYYICIYVFYVFHVVAKLLVGGGNFMKTVSYHPLLEYEVLIETNEAAPVPAQQEKFCDLPLQWLPYNFPYSAVNLRGIQN